MINHDNAMQIIENGWVDHRAFRRLAKHVLTRRALILNLHQLVAAFTVSALKSASLKELSETFYFFYCQLSFAVVHGFPRLGLDSEFFEWNEVNGVALRLEVVHRSVSHGNIGGRIGAGAICKARVARLKQCVVDIRVYLIAALLLTDRYIRELPASYRADHGAVIRVETYRQDC